MEDHIKQHEMIKSLSSSENIYNSDEALDNINKICKRTYNSKNLLELIKTSLNYNYEKTIIDFFIYALPIINEKLKNNDLSQLKNDLRMFKYIAAMMNTVHNYTNRSINFCIHFHEYNGLKILMDYLNNDKLIEHISNLNYFNRIVRSSIGSLLNLSKVFDNYINQWKAVNAVENIVKFVQKTNNFKIQAFICLASISDEEEIKKFDLKNIINEIVNIITKCAEAIKTQENLKRIEISLNENETDLCMVCEISNWNLIELLNALYHMAVNDSIKYEIYFEHKMCDILKDIINHGSEAEIEYSLKLLYQLCFEKKIIENVSNDKDLFGKIENLAQKTSDIRKGTSKNCQGIVWLNKQRLSETTNNLNTEKNTEKKKDDKKQIMISYNRDSREYCLAIKKQLENEYIIWIDVENIHGSSLESMAKAIESSDVVLICLTEKYKQSNNCRAEAEYAFNLNKPIVPLIMQKNYRPRGWLGIIMGSKIFIDFFKYEFEESVLRIKKEILQYTSDGDLNLNQEIELKNSNDIKTKINPIVLKSQPIKINSSVLEWTQENVVKWMNEQKIHATIISNISENCDGKVLNQIFDIEKRAPEFFYSSINTNKQLSISEVAKFVISLKSLFE